MNLLKIFKRIFVSLSALICIIIIRHLFSLIIIYDANQITKISHFSNNVFLLDSGTWIFNFIVSQYSSIYTKQHNNLIQIESLILLDNEDHSKEGIACLTNYNQSFFLIKPIEILKVQLMPVRNKPKSLFKVKCIFKSSNEINSLNVAIINQKMFNQIKPIIYNLTIFFHRAKFYDTSIAKEKKVVNCVHMVRNLNEKKLKGLLDWTLIQKKIGIAKVKLYFIEYNKTLDKYLKNIYNLTHSNFIQTVNYNTSFNEICKYQIKMLKSYPTSRQYVYLYEICKQAFEQHFTIEDLDAFNTHERVNDNDCYLNFKYQYEFVANFDFDEFVLPRILDKKLDLKNPTFLENLELSKFNFSYDIYSYAFELTRRLSKNFKTNIAYLMFDHIVLLNDSDDLVKKMFDFKFKQSFFSFIDIFNLLSAKKNLRYTSKNGNYINFTIYHNHFDVLTSTKSVATFINYLNQTYIKNQFKLSSKWNNALGFLCKYRDGKSIYNTNYTEGMNQHFSNNILYGSKSVKVPFSYGHISHFRDQIYDIISNQTFSFDYLNLDLDYYIFLIRLVNSKI